MQIEGLRNVFLTPCTLAFWKPIDGYQGPHDIAAVGEHEREGDHGLADQPDQRPANQARHDTWNIMYIDGYSQKVNYIFWYINLSFLVSAAAS